MTLSEQVRDLERRHYEAITLLGSICTTLLLPRNVDVLQQEKGGKVVVEMVREWMEGFRRLERESKL
jgi:hypothetical protein